MSAEDVARKMLELKILTQIYDVVYDRCVYTMH